jgi:hypothetical protein
MQEKCLSICTESNDEHPGRSPTTASSMLCFAAGPSPYRYCHTQPITHLLWRQAWKGLSPEVNGVERAAVELLGAPQALAAVHVRVIDLPMAS